MRPGDRYEYGLWKNQPILYLPGTSTSLAGKGLGPDWVSASSGTVVVSHPAMSNNFVDQHRKTRITSAAVTADQECGIHFANADCNAAWRGDTAGAGEGGFFLEARFRVQSIANTAVRLFCGLSSVNAAGVCQADALTGDAIGLWCDATDAGNLTIVTRDNATTTKNALSASATLAAGNSYLFRLFAYPAQSNILYALYNLATNAAVARGSITTTLPRNSIFMGPQLGLSNAANAGAGDAVLDIISLYLLPNNCLQPGTR